MASLPIFETEAAFGPVFGTAPRSDHFSLSAHVLNESWVQASTASGSPLVPRLESSCHL